MRAAILARLLPLSYIDNKLAQTLLGRHDNLNVDVVELLLNEGANPNAIIHTWQGEQLGRSIIHMFREVFANTPNS